MKKTILSFIIMAALVLSLAGCGSVPPAENKAPADETQAAPEAQSPAAEDAQIVVEESSDIPAEPGREDGERFESTIMMEGMEEPVSYEHLKNTALGFQMDYDYENFVRRSEADRELFISDWDDPESPENYLEVRSDAGNYSLVADAVSAALTLLSRSENASVTAPCIRMTLRGVSFAASASAAARSQPSRRNSPSSEKTAASRS